MKIPLLILAAALAGAAEALTLTLLPAQQSASPGAILTFYGRIVNDGPNGVSLVGNGHTEVSGDFSGFVVGDLDGSVPFALASGASYEGVVFQASIPETATFGDRFARYAVYGDDGSPNPIVAENAFGIQVVPEPASTLALAVGIGGVFIRRRSRRN